MAYNPKIHNRKSIRLKGYDYSRSGLYFLTVCVKNNWHMFGRIPNGVPKMNLNEAGRMVGKWYQELENKYPNMRCGEYIVMPNHFHCIIEIVAGASDVTGFDSALDAHTGTSVSGRPDAGGDSENGRPNAGEYGYRNKKYDASIFDMMGWFKTMTTNEYIRSVNSKKWRRFDKKLWQLRYHDRIIRDERAHQNIANYIINNPAKWAEDRFNGKSF